MRLQKITEIEDFLDAVMACRGSVILTSPQGDKYNLKSLFSRYIAIGALLGNHGDELELWCENKEDEQNFFAFFNHHPDVLH